MNILETLVGASFKKSSTGEVLYFPWGTLGRGYVVPGADLENRIRTFLRRYYIVTFIVAIGSIVLIGGLGMLIMLVPLVGWYAIRAKSLTKSLAKSADKMTYKESSEAMARKIPFGLLAVLLAVSVLLAVTGLLLAILAQALLGILILLFFGVCSYLYVRMILAKKRHSSKRD